MRIDRGVHVPWRTMYTVTVTFMNSTLVWNAAAMVRIAGKYMFAVSGLCAYICW